MDYCLYTTSCYALKVDKKSINEDRYKCCFTCPKKDKCDIACKDRDKSKSKCPYLTTKEDVINFWHLNDKLPTESTEKVIKKEVAKVVAQEEKKPEVVEVKVEEKKEKKMSSPRKSTPKKEKLPATVKGLAALLKVPYQKVNYLVKTKGLTFEEVYEKLKGDK